MCQSRESHAKAQSTQRTETENMNLICSIQLFSYNDLIKSPSLLGLSSVSLWQVFTDFDAWIPGPLESFQSKWRKKSGHGLRHVDQRRRLAQQRPWRGLAAAQWRSDC